MTSTEFVEDENVCIRWGDNSKRMNLCKIVIFIALETFYPLVIY